MDSGLECTDLSHAHQEPSRLSSPISRLPFEVRSPFTASPWPLALPTLDPSVCLQTCELDKPSYAKMEHSVELSVGLEATRQAAIGWKLPDLQPYHYHVQLSDPIFGPAAVTIATTRTSETHSAQAKVANFREKWAHTSLGGLEKSHFV
ncbi:unnamed protein product [Protopolystoma xenopodis]|uniref:Uncharacterized protein n=1 Tax=Protopolystoma xenopodis TaxID=117903 RepID=A0A3S5AGY1_9PLAT|nr:unnamed protein product [Protopolystoma xenopodis]